MLAMAAFRDRGLREPCRNPERSLWTGISDHLPPSGRIHAERRGSGDSLVLGIPGLSANLRGFDFLAERLVDAHTVVVLDLRGRGQSEVTGPGTYGWANHARDVLALADALGAAQFAVVGQSMGAFVAMQIARQAPDGCGRPSSSTRAGCRTP
jgi:pimeloyl-ACP methyl ester carboxylesterase